MRNPLLCLLCVVSTVCLAQQGQPAMHRETGTREALSRVSETTGDGPMADGADPLAPVQTWDGSPFGNGEYNAGGTAAANTYVWKPVNLVGAVGLPALPAPQCAASIRGALALVATGIAQSDDNQVFSGYDWFDLDQDQAEAPENLLMHLGAGSWMVRAEVASSSRSDDAIGEAIASRGGGSRPQNPADLHFRWIRTDGSPGGEFGAVTRAGCWFLKEVAFSSDTPAGDRATPTDSTSPGMVVPERGRIHEENLLQEDIPTPEKNEGLRG